VVSDYVEQIIKSETSIRLQQERFKVVQTRPKAGVQFDLKQRVSHAP
jgi:hypothetical protein